MGKAIEDVAALFPYMRTVKVSFKENPNQWYTYTLNQKIELKPGDHVLVPTRDQFAIATVKEVLHCVEMIHRPIYCKINEDGFHNMEKRFTNTMLTLASWKSKADSASTRSTVQDWEADCTNF